MGLLGQIGESPISSMGSGLGAMSNKLGLGNLGQTQLGRAKSSADRAWKLTEEQRRMRALSSLLDTYGLGGELVGQHLSLAGRRRGLAEQLRLGLKDARRQAVGSTPIFGSLLAGFDT
jgi:hypothetical protein